MEKQSKILVTGASGLIGSALVRLLKAEGYEDVITKCVDLTEQEAVQSYFYNIEPEYVFHLAAHVGGIEQNSTEPADFIYNNTLMQCNVLENAREIGVKKLLFPGSACAYPHDAEQPIKESSFLQGMPEPTNLAYALAKQNGIVMAKSYAKQYGMKVVLPMVANTYGIGDKSSHVIPDFISKIRSAVFCECEDIFLWGSGAQLREFIYADDVAEAFLFLMKNYDSDEIINVGTMEEARMFNLAYVISQLLGYKGNIVCEPSKPEGMPRKCLDSSHIRSLGWSPKISLAEGLRRVIAS